MRKVICLLVFLCAVFTGFGYAEKLSVLPGLNSPTTIEIVDNELFVIDSVVVYVFSLKDYKLVRKFGKRGEGPGELLPNPEISPQMEVLDGKVYVSTPTKSICFSKEGKMLSEKKFAVFSPQIIHHGKYYALTKAAEGSDGIQRFKVGLYDANMKGVKDIYSRNREAAYKKGKIEIPPFLLYIRSYKDKLYVFDHVKGFHIDVFDKDGKPLKPIDVDYDKVKVTKAYEKELFDWLSIQPHYKESTMDVKSMIAVAEYLPVMKTFLISEDKIYVQTYVEKDGKSEFVIVDLKGKVLKKLFLPVEIDAMKIQASPDVLFAFRGDTCYCIKENTEDEVWVLHKFSVK